MNNNNNQQRRLDILKQCRYCHQAGNGRWWWWISIIVSWNNGN
jgi:hypothetical protein